MFKNFILKKMLRTQGVPPEQIDMIINIMEKDPELFKKITAELKEKMDSGMDQMTAGMQLMEKYKDEIKKLA